MDAFQSHSIGNLLNYLFHRSWNWLAWFPLPPYITRSSVLLDNSRYQTIYAKHEGSVAAPTAGLHFTEKTMGILKKKNISFKDVTLHVGIGTLQAGKCGEYWIAHYAFRKSFC